MFGAVLNPSRRGLPRRGHGVFGERGYAAHGSLDQQRAMRKKRLKEDW